MNWSRLWYDNHGFAHICLVIELEISVKVSNIAHGHLVLSVYHDYYLIVYYDIIHLLDVRKF